MNTFILLAIAAGVVLLIVEGAFMARLKPEQIVKITTHSVLTAVGVVLLIFIIMNKVHWIFLPVAVVIPFLDGIYRHLQSRGKIQQWLDVSHFVSREVGRFAQHSRSALRETTRSQPQTQPPAPARHGDMTSAEALQILGLTPGADEQSIKEAHRRLMRTLHPDRGGDPKKAAKVNRAKDILLGE